MKQSATQNQYSSSQPFKAAAAAFGRVWRSKYRGEPVPSVSHALSTLSSEDDTWSLRCAETGDTLCRVDSELEVSWPGEEIQEEPCWGSIKNNIPPS